MNYDELHSWIIAASDDDLATLEMTVRAGKADRRKWQRILTRATKRTVPSRAIPDVPGALSELWPDLEFDRH